MSCTGDKAPRLSVGAGRMGEVYRARDTTLGRDVAIKVLPEAYARDEERLSGFQREARVVASLNHPNIAALYASRKCRVDISSFLEIVPENTLAERIARAPLALEDALPLSSRVSSAS